MHIDRRIVLKAGAAWLLTSAANLPGEELAVPVVDGLELTVLVDSTTAVFGDAVTRPGFRSLPPPITRDYHTAFAGQWGYSLLATSTIGRTARRTLVDFGYTPEALLNNMTLLGVDPVTIDAAVLSHGHYDHFGGLDGLLATGKVRRGVPLFVGGEEALCARVRGVDPNGSPFGALDRLAIRAAGLDLHVSPEPAIIADHGFTTGRIPLTSPERPRVRPECCRARDAVGNCSILKSGPPPSW